jgi:hypothetical protein
MGWDIHAVLEYRLGGPGPSGCGHLPPGRWNCPTGGGIIDLALGKEGQGRHPQPLAKGSGKLVM